MSEVTKCQKKTKMSVGEKTFGEGVCVCVRVCVFVCESVWVSVCVSGLGGCGFKEIFHNERKKILKKNSRENMLHCGCSLLQNAELVFLFLLLLFWSWLLFYMARFLSTILVLFICHILPFLWALRCFCPLCLSHCENCKKKKKKVENF